jgi:hypothetical protein
MAVAPLHGKPMAAVPHMVAPTGHAQPTAGQAVGHLPGALGPEARHRRTAAVALAMRGDPRHLHMGLQLTEVAMVREVLGEVERSMRLHQVWVSLHRLLVLVVRRRRVWVYTLRLRRVRVAGL